MITLFNRTENDPINVKFWSFPGGDRWCPVWGQGDDEPLIYGTRPAAYTEHFAEPGEVFCRVFYLDGRIAEFHKPAPFLIAGE